MQPAIEYARLGAPLAPGVARSVAAAHAQYAAAPHEERFAGWFDTFAPGGHPPRAGELLRLPDHADTLEDIAATAARSFYEGALMRRMVAFARQTGGYWDEEDFALFAPRAVEPLSVGYRGYDIHELPPNGQGLAALLALQLLEGFETEPFASPAALHCEVEAMKLAFADAACHIADPAHMRTTPQALLDPGYAAARRALIGARAAQYGPGPAPDHGTVYLCTADSHGNMVSMIQSNYMGFGSGMVVPGTGIALHNRGHNFSLEAGHANCIGPRKYPYHTIIPGFITRGGQPVGCFGVMGGFMQPQGHVQVVRNLIDHGMNPQAALDAPRWRWDAGLRIALESAFDPHAAQALAAWGHEIAPAHKAGFFGHGQILLRGADGVYAAGCDGRCDSQVAAW